MGRTSRHLPVASLQGSFSGCWAQTQGRPRRPQDEGKLWCGQTRPSSQQPNLPPSDPVTEQPHQASPYLFNTQSSESESCLLKRLEGSSPTGDLKVTFLNQTKGKTRASRGPREGRAAEDRVGRGFQSAEWKG